ncbi:MAG: ABC transporter permease [Candidatus Omnitrophica bacterium]|nr:ABC transporter permease [Candidatus Omnitrophota bacterium]
MASYILRRVLSSIPLLLGITLISFVVIHLAPGEPTDMQTEMNPRTSSEVKQQLRELYHLDKPIPVQYWYWLKKLTVLDFGTSHMDGRPALKKIAERIPITLTINIASILLVMGVAIPIGIHSALYRGSRSDRWLTLLVFIGYAMPTFWLALLLMDWLGVRLMIVPISGLTSLEYGQMNLLERCLDLLHHLALPIFVSAFGGLAGISRYMRSSMVHVLQQDYIRTARAKGLGEMQVIRKHALRNACLPIVTIMGLMVPGLIGGSVIFETIFSIPGMGRLYFDSVLARDYPIIMGLLVIGAVLTLLGNLLADLAYSWVDPRIRYQEPES